MQSYKLDSKILEKMILEMAKIKNEQNAQDILDRAEILINLALKKQITFTG